MTVREKATILHCVLHAKFPLAECQRLVETGGYIDLVQQDRWAKIIWGRTAHYFPPGVRQCEWCGMYARTDRQRPRGYCWEWYRSRFLYLIELDVRTDGYDEEVFARLRRDARP